MLFDYLRRGVLAGGIAGLAYGMFMAFVANPLTDYIHDIDHGHGHDHGHAHEASHAVSETTTAVVSIGSGLLWAIFLGGVFGIALYLTEPALPGKRTARAFVLAGAGFLTVSATPWLVLPPATPGAEHLYGISPRLAIYAGLVVVGGIISAAAILSYRRFSQQRRVRGVAAGLAPIVVVAVVVPIATPTVVTHPDLPAALVGAYQAMVVLSQAGLWALIAGSYSWLAGRDAGTTETAPTAMPDSA